jgi:PAS domain S-box-containing protein
MGDSNNRPNTSSSSSEEQFRRLFTLSPVGVVMVGLDFRFQRCNEAFCQLVGYREEELIGKTFAEVTSPEDRSVGATEIEAIARNELEVAQFQKRYLRRDGMVVWGEINIRMVRDQDGTPLHFLSIVQDISARKRGDEERARLQARLQQAEKMESVGRLAGGVAHDFNNKLGVILGHVEMALEHVDPALPVYADLVEIRKATQQSADLTRQLLAFARKQTIAPKMLDLNETVAGMLKMLRRLLGENIDLNWQPGPELWPIRMDPSQIDQILTNLCVNGRDAICGFGKMTIETGNSRFDSQYCAAHAGTYPGEFVRLAVSDTGRGMDKETLAHVFEPFFTTKGIGKGTGLGLATVYGAVKQNDGFINAYSEPALGTTITIYLPRYVGKVSSASTEDAAKPTMRGNETILLVEDEPAMLKMTAIILKRQGYSVLAADTPGEAIRLAREHSGTIDLLITDVVMPEMNGRDLAKNLLSLYPDIKRLFMSGYTADVIAHHGVLEEGVDFIQKPFPREVLATRVREVLDGGSRTAN